MTSEVVTIPSWKFHTARSTGDKGKAHEIHELLDIDSLHLFSHHEWRSKTHDILPAIIIGFSLDGVNGAANALQHIMDDRTYNALFSKKKLDSADDSSLD